MLMASAHAEDKHTEKQERVAHDSIVSRAIATAWRCVFGDTRRKDRYESSGQLGPGRAKSGSDRRGRNGKKNGMPYWPAWKTRSTPYTPEIFLMLTRMVSSWRRSAISRLASMRAFSLSGRLSRLWIFEPALLMTAVISASKPARSLARIDSCTGKVA